MDANQQIGEIRRELTNPQLAQQRYKERKEHYKIDKRILLRKVWDTAADIAEFPINFMEMVLSDGRRGLGAGRGPTNYDIERHEMAKVSSTLVDFLENSTTEEKKVLFRELIRGQYNLTEAGQWLYNNWSQSIIELGRDIACQD